MCVYCAISDFNWKHDPLWPKPLPTDPITPWHPTIPKPADPTKPIVPWSLERLKEYRDLLKEVQELEDKVGCPCEPKEANYVDLLEKRIEQLKKELEEKNG